MHFDMQVETNFVFFDRILHFFQFSLATLQNYYLLTFPLSSWINFHQFALFSDLRKQ